VVGSFGAGELHSHLGGFLETLHPEKALERVAQRVVPRRSGQRFAVPLHQLAGDDPFPSEAVGQIDVGIAAGRITVVGRSFQRGQRFVAAIELGG